MQFIIALMATVVLAKVVEPCNELLIKAMAVKVCGMNKRSFGSDNDWLTSPFPRATIEREYKKLFENEKEPKEKIFNKINKGKPKEPTDNKRLRPDYFIPLYDLLLNSKSILNPALNDENEKLSRNQKRDVDALVKECCDKTCTISDFRSICDKK